KGNWTYIDRYGERLTGVQTIDKVTYDFGEQGFIKEGWDKLIIFGTIMIEFQE
ncbi:Cell wall binding repeat protein, partial [human gut metagenome]